MKIIKNHWVIGIGTIVIGGLILYYIFGIGGSQPLTTPTQKTEQIRTNLLPLSIFSLAEKMNNFSGTSIEKDEFFRKYIELITEDEGYIYDVSKFVGNQISVYLKKELDNRTLGGGVYCIFNSDWVKTLTVLQKGQKIKFSGIVSGYRSLDDVELENCELR